MPGELQKMRWSRRTEVRRKDGPFYPGDLEAGELGLDINSAILYVSTDGTSVNTVGAGGGGGVTYDAIDTIEELNAIVGDATIVTFDDIQVLDGGTV